MFVNFNCNSRTVRWAIISSKIFLDFRTLEAKAIENFFYLIENMSHEVLDLDFDDDS